jgi:hypothetical protein
MGSAGGEGIWRRSILQTHVSEARRGAGGMQTGVAQSAAEYAGYSGVTLKRLDKRQPVRVSIWIYCRQAKTTKIA